MKKILKIINKENKISNAEQYKKMVKDIIEMTYSLSSNNPKSIFDLIFSMSIQKNYGYRLIQNKIVIRKENNYFDIAFKNAIDNNYGYYLIYNKVINKTDKYYFDECVKNAIKDKKSNNLIYDGIIDKTSKYYNDAISDLIKDNYGYDLLLTKKVVKEDELFPDCFKNAIRDGKAKGLLDYVIDESYGKYYKMAMKAKK